MKRLIACILLVTFSAMSWAVPKPMESITNYNVMMVHGAYGPKNDDGELQGFDPGDYSQAIEATEHLGAASMGSYTSNNRVTRWISHNILEEPKWEKDSSYVRNSYVYNWRAFSNTRNSSKNNAVELGDRTWNKDKIFGQRRALVEEAQEVKAVYDTLRGQTALEIIRQNPDLYRQLASRYILIGHSMGGVVSREYVQGDFYNGDVDKIITLDSPHEGTGALNMQIAMQFDNTDNLATLIGEGISNWIPMTAALATATALMSKDLATSTVALYGFIASLGLGSSNYLLGGATELLLEDYSPDDPLVHYVDPTYTGDNINILKTKENDPDSLPMFRLLAMEHSMTFTDPDKGARSTLGIFVPDALTVPFANVAYQLSGDDSFGVNYVNAFTGLYLGFLAGVNVQGKGSSLVETDVGLAKQTKMLTDSDVDVKRNVQNAASNASSNTASLIMGVTGAVGVGMLAAELIPYTPVKMALKVAIPLTAAATLTTTSLEAFAAGVMDLSTSHNLPIDKGFKDWMLNNSVHVYEDFLYERPFVNLALNDTATLNKLQGMSSTAREKSTLNRNCFYIGSKNGVNCAIGLFKAANDLNSTQKNQPLSGLTTPLRFKSESDWSKMGVKVDRWEKVDGLHPDGSLNEKGVPIRHVERYEVPAITVDDWIEKYSFVVDDLMPHRLRQIRMNFNYQEEIAWECDASKDYNAPDNCTVYKRTSGGEWTELRKEKHPVRKNGAFDFKPRDYGYVFRTI